MVNVYRWLSSRERERAKGMPAAVRSLSCDRRTCTRTNVTAQEQRDYEDAAGRFHEAAKLANELAFEIAAEKARRTTAVYSAPLRLPAAIEKTEKLRKNLQAEIARCHRWHGGSYDLPAQEWTFYLGLTTADLNLPAALVDEAQSLAVLAFNLRRASDLFSDLARTEAPRGRGKADAAATRRLLHAADAFSIPPRKLAEVAVDNCNATLGTDADEELTRDTHIEHWLKHFRDVRRSYKRER